MNERTPFPFTAEEIGPDVLRAVDRFNSGGLENWLRNYVEKAGPSNAIYDNGTLMRWSRNIEQDPVLKDGVDTTIRTWTQWDNPNLYQKEHHHTYSLFGGFKRSTLKHAMDRHRQQELCPQYVVTRAQATENRAGNFTILDAGMGDFPIMRAIYNPNGDLRYVAGHMHLDDYIGKNFGDQTHLYSEGYGAGRKNAVLLSDGDPSLVQPLTFFEMYVEGRDYYTEITAYNSFPMYYPRQDNLIKKSANRGEIQRLRSGTTFGFTNAKIGIFEDGEMLKIGGYVDEVEATYDTHELVIPTHISSNRLHYFLTTNHALNLSGIRELVPVSGKFTPFGIEFDNQEEGSLAA